MILVVVVVVVGGLVLVAGVVVVGVLVVVGCVVVDGVLVVLILEDQILTIFFASCLVENLSISLLPTL